MFLVRLRKDFSPDLNGFDYEGGSIFIFYHPHFVFKHGGT